jgi:hypothetical protein
MSLSTTAMSEPPMIGHGDTIEHFLTGQKGRRVTVRLGSGEDLTGTVREATGPLVHLSDLTDPAFADAVVVTKSIAAVLVGARTP